MNSPQTATPTTSALDLPHAAPGLVFNMATPLVDRHVAEGRGGRPAVYLGDKTLTYADLQHEVNRAGNALREAGLSTEQRVALLLPDGVEFIATFIGAMKIGAVPIPLNTMLPAEDALALLADSRARVVVGTPDLVLPVLQGELPPLLRAALLVGGLGREGATRPPITLRSYDEAVASASPELEAFPTGVDEPCYWLYSSGTTGRSKGVVHLHGDMVAAVAPYAEEVVGITPDDIAFSVAKLFFSYGLVNSLFLPLLGGASVALWPGRPEPASLLEVVGKHRPTLYFSVPTSYTQLCALLEREKIDPRQALASMRLAVSAGEPLPAPLYERWKGMTGIELLDGIGSTEVGYIYCSNLPGRVRTGSSGVMLGDHEARVIDEDGHDAPDGEAGELWVKARSTALHYWNQRARTKETFVGEWLRTGDRYTRDSDGYYWYIGRANDVFKVSGQWVSPIEVESCLLTHPGVLECAIIGVPDSQGLVKTKAYVVRRPNAAVTEAELQALVKEHLLPHKYPRWVEFVDELPKTATGKVQRFKLRELKVG